MLLFLRRAGDGKWWNGTGFVSTTDPAGIPLTTNLSGQVWARRSGLPTTAQLTAGTYRLLVKAYDRAQNTRLANVTFRVLAPATAAASARGVVALSPATARARSSSVQLKFAGALEAESASDASHYSVTVNGRAVVVEAASYDATRQTVTLSLPEGSLTAGDRVTMKWQDVLDAQGNPVTGETGTLTAR